jgi:hypothetical protein
LGRIKKFLKEKNKRRKIGERTGNKGKVTPKKEEKQCREKQLQCGQTAAEQLESGQAPTWSNGWIEDQPILSQEESR